MDTSSGIIPYVKVCVCVFAVYFHQDGADLLTVTLNMIMMMLPDEELSAWIVFPRSADNSFSSVILIMDLLIKMFLLSNWWFCL